MWHDKEIREARAAIYDALGRKRMRQAILQISDEHTAAAVRYFDKAREIRQAVVRW